MKKLGSLIDFFRTAIRHRINRKQMQNKSAEYDLSLSPFKNDGIVIYPQPLPEGVRKRTITFVTKLEEMGIIGNEYADQWRANIIESFMLSETR